MKLGDRASAHLRAATRLPSAAPHDDKRAGPREGGPAGTRTFLAFIPHLRPRWLLGLTFVLGLAATIGAGWWVQREMEQEAHRVFAARAGDLTDQLNLRLRAYNDVIYSIRAFMDHASALEINRDEFHRFVVGLAVADRFPGLTNISFTYHVTGAARAAFERRMRGEFEGLLPDARRFEIRPAGERDGYEVATYIEPLAGNVVAVGLDLATDPVRNDAVIRARDSGVLATTAPMTLLRDRDAPTTSVLLRLAVYDGGSVPRTQELRRQAYAGVAGVAIQLSPMLEAAFPAEALKQMRVVVDDISGQERAPGEIRSGGRLLFDSLAAQEVAFPQYDFIHKVDVGDRRWEVRISPLRDPLQNSIDGLLPYATGGAILMIVLLVCGLLRSLAMAKAQGVELRHTVKTLEYHRRRLAETQHIANIGGWEWDTRQPTQIWSDSLYQLLGRAVGDPPAPTDEFFISHVVHPADILLARDALKRVIKEGTPVEIECRVLRPDGTERVVSSLTQLETTDDGARARLVGTVRDITEEHRAAARERAQLVFIQTMMDAIPTPVFEKDSAGRFRACNDAWCQFLGVPRDAILGSTADKFIAPPNFESMREQDRALLLRPAASSIEIALPNAAGEVRQLMIHKASYLADDGTIAGLVGVIFDITDRKLAEQRLQRTVAELDLRNVVAKLLGELSEALQSCGTLDEAYETVAKFLPRLVPGSAGILYRVNPAYGQGEKAISWGEATAATSTLADGDCVAIRRGRARNVSDSAKDLNCRHFTARAPRAYACLPLSAQGDLIGLLHVEDSEEKRCESLHADGWAALTTAAEHIALALANLALRETLREQATHDKLTGLYNRHYLNARFEQELARAKRGQQPLAIIMFDIDHFKRFNDTFGHAAGDHVLRELARVVSHSARKSDVACRYGGEEFVLFLPETTAALALRRAEEIREAVKGLRLEWEGKPLGGVTASAGIATYPEHGDDPGSLMRFADRALYQAKELGRDRVVLARAETGVPAGSAQPGR
ncbi:MAG: diguanylate cyclase [Casimicrobiaceae bacterium]